MDNYSIIDKETYEVCTHAEDHPQVFICDKTIAPVISILNKRGYKTYASCSGHYRIEFYEYCNEDICNLKEFQKDDRIIIKKIKDTSFDYWQEIDKTRIYILFTNEYLFDNLPAGFNISTNNGLDYSRTYIECIINYYDENNEHKKMSDVLKEIDSKCELLKEWATQLPIISNKI